jgi:arsenate reductase (glutaredoxin)
MKVKLYGIPNCDTVKKARAWLEGRRIEVEFHDFKKEGLAPAKVKEWLKQAEWTQLVNRSGMTWRKLDGDTKAAVTTAATAARLMCQQPSVVKRPVVEYGAKLVVGFHSKLYKDNFEDISRS